MGISIPKFDPCEPFMLSLRKQKCPPRNFLGVASVSSRVKNKICTPEDSIAAAGRKIFIFQRNPQTPRAQFTIEKTPRESSCSQSYGTNALRKRKFMQNLYSSRQARRSACYSTSALKAYGSQQDFVTQNRQNLHCKLFSSAENFFRRIYAGRIYFAWTFILCVHRAHNKGEKWEHQN